MDVVPVATAGLADRLWAFRFDEPDATATFLDRLANHNGWAKVYAGRVVEEYRRFLWLAASSSELASPSPAVDRAWHLHLLDTRSYWDQLCPMVLGRPLHHEPSRGGPVERSRLQTAYARTVDRYRRAWGDPPGDIWTPPGHGRRPRLRVIDLGATVPIPRRLLALAGFAVLVGLAIVAKGAIIGCARALLVPSGLVFGGAMVNLAAGIVATAGFLRHRSRRGPRPLDARAATLDHYGQGFLVAGPDGAIDVAITELVVAGALFVRGRGLCRGAAPLRESTWLQQLVLRGVAEQPAGELSAQRPPAAAIREALEPELIEDGLIIPYRRRVLAVAVPLAGTGLMAALCTARAVASGGAPGWLLLYLPLFTLLAVLATTGTILRTVRGDAALERLRAAFPVPAPTSPAHADYAALVACFGAESLRASTLVELADLLAPRPPPSDSYGSGCGCGG